MSNRYEELMREAEEHGKKAAFWARCSQVLALIALVLALFSIGLHILIVFCR